MFAFGVVTVFSIISLDTDSLLCVIFYIVSTIYNMKMFIFGAIYFEKVTKYSFIIANNLYI